MRKKNLLFKIILFFIKDPDPEPVKNRPDPQHWRKRATYFCIIPVSLTSKTNL